jgi:hypothetical protein
VVAATLFAATATHHVPADCQKTFTAPMITRAVDAAYSGTGDVSRADRHHLRHYIHCARRHVSRAKMRHYLHKAWVAWKERRNPPMSSAIASWYDTEGVGACGYGTVQTGYRFASLILPCGATARFCHGAVCIVGEMADHGPYVAGRTFDFNVNMKNALGCGGVCSITWRRLS